MLQSLLLLALLQGDAARSALIRADSAYRSAVRQSGLAAATEAMLADDGIVLYGGAPVVEGRATAARLLRAQPVLESLTVAWEPSEVWLSRDGSFGVIYGRTTISEGSGGVSRSGVVIAAWKSGPEWRLAGLMMTGLAPSDQTRLARDIGPLAHPPVDAESPLRDLVDADNAFSRLAQRTNAGEAFKAFAAPNAILLGGPSPLRGPDAIGASFAAGPKATWIWHPVAVRGSAAGDLGFTVGEAIITPVDAAQPPAYSKYLSVWMRLTDGSVRYLTDGGNPRPKP